MKVIALLLIVLAFVDAEKCSAELKKIAEKNVESYLSGIYDKKIKKVKLNCTYNHDANIFNLEHKIKADVKYKDKKISFQMKTHSSMFDLYNFTDFDGFICHSKFENLKVSTDRKLIRKSFIQKYAKSVKDKDITTYKKKGQVCYKAEVDNNRKRKLKLKKSLL